MSVKLAILSLRAREVGVGMRSLLDGSEFIKSSFWIAAKKDINRVFLASSSFFSSFYPNLPQ